MFDIVMIILCYIIRHIFNHWTSKNPSLHLKINPTWNWNSFSVKMREFFFFRFSDGLVRNYYDNDALSEFYSLSVDENAKGVQTENHRHYSPISLNVSGCVGDCLVTANLSLFEHQFTFKPVAKSWCILKGFKGVGGALVFALVGLLHIVCKGRLSCRIAVFNESKEAIENRYNLGVYIRRLCGRWQWGRPGWFLQTG